MVNRIESHLVIVWLSLLLRMDTDVYCFVIPTRQHPTVSQCTSHPMLLPKKRRRLRNVTASRCAHPMKLFITKNDDEGNDEIEESDESQTSIISYNDFDDFALTTGISPSSSSSSSSSSSFYNDFDDQTIGVDNDDIKIINATPVGKNNNSKDDDGMMMKTDVLLSRMSSLQREEQRRIAVCDRNWKLGNWFVRGFSLEETTVPMIIPTVSTVVTSSSVVDIYSVDDDDGGDDDDMLDMLPKQIDVWVGRTDGSIFGIRFGTDYWTRLGNSDATVDECDTPGGRRDAASRNVLDEGDDDDDDDDDSGESFSNIPTEMNPFTIVTKFQSTSSSAITSMVALPAMTDDDDAEIMKFDIYVACKDSMIIEHWCYDGHAASYSNSFIATQSTQNEAPSILTLRRIHTKVNKVPTTMILAVNDGSMTLWDTKTDTMVGFINTIQIPDVPGGPGSYDIQTITCIDADNEFVYIGTDSGYVLVYAVHDILQQNHPPSASIAAVGYWRAAPTDDCSITAIKCGGPGTLGRNSATTTSSVLYTGDGQGLVKQWEVLKLVTNSEISSSNDNDSSADGKMKYKVEAWPKLSTQRLPKKAHVFAGHSDAITGLLSVDALKFVSASVDGTVRAWNTATGKELFRMDGFPDPIRNLCLLDSGTTDESTDRLQNTILVTDGMDKYVCVHDFSADDEDTADYDLEMPEYIS